MEGIPPQVLAQLVAPAPDDKTTMVLMTCGISGSGKSTLAKSICNLKTPQYASFRSNKADNENPRNGPYNEPAPADRGATRVNVDPLQRDYVRLSIDQYIWDHYGRYGIDYPPEKYPEYQSEASEELDKLFVRLLKRNRAQVADEEGVQAPWRPLTIVLDYSFATKAGRDEVKEIVEREGGHWVLIYFAVSENRQAIRERVSGRKTKRDVESGSCDGDNAFEVTDEVLHTYFETFQVPRGEGEIVIH